jgi:hypothetical protein
MQPLPRGERGGGKAQDLRPKDLEMDPSLPWGRNPNAKCVCSSRAPGAAPLSRCSPLVSALQIAESNASALSHQSDRFEFSEENR